MPMSEAVTEPSLTMMTTTQGITWEGRTHRHTHTHTHTHRDSGLSSKLKFAYDFANKNTQEVKYEGYLFG